MDYLCSRFRRMDKPELKTTCTPEQLEIRKGLKRRLVEDWFGVGNEPRLSDYDSSSGNRSVKGKAPIEPWRIDDDDNSSSGDSTPLEVEKAILDAMFSDDYKCDASSRGGESGIGQGDSQSDMKITESVSAVPCGEGEDGCSIRPKAALNSPACGQGQGDRKKRRLAETR
ncbi:hypothetical protein Dsin_000418 [Dipteronia sinensis]|uniref:Uncharacterized protein n=1 Tax=Dipteronia sinensis TaxID=43782 RepID=A0AAE0B372_9ROSI|nr:hypothetical protein Dsin_000418 [Dipteronia sinensis]